MVVRPGARALCLVLLVVAVAWMHTVAAAGVLAPRAHHGAGAAHCPSAPCEDPGGDEGGDQGAGGHGQGHAGSMCQAPFPGGTAWSPVLTALPFQAAPPGPSLPTTVAVDAAGGTGCGPPSLTMLSILRT
ncbi:DUF6153 family protein [Dactylosporangium sp. AC04546]|uniref:DUF6153 family protein n=1 Tax=Dactylosporangium sp. AC04546 TaxID=2862460 RepID=UPI001EDF11EE|nr:DUF6153 family protein [Dactylosporangium sp. AC04546]WVK79308.1 DUF6153 family protein [Dactylosporangium sp. AC04546]